MDHILHGDVPEVCFFQETQGSIPQTARDNKDTNFELKQVVKSLLGLNLEFKHRYNQLEMENRFL